MNTVTNWFFFSEKQNALNDRWGRRPRENFVIVDGQKLQYSEWQTSTLGQGKSNWDDAVLVATIVGTPKTVVEWGDETSPYGTYTGEEDYDPCDDDYEIDDD